MIGALIAQENDRIEGRLEGPLRSRDFNLVHKILKLTAEHQIHQFGEGFIQGA